MSQSQSTPAAFVRAARFFAIALTCSLALAIAIPNAGHSFGFSLFTNAAKSIAHKAGHAASSVGHRVIHLGGKAAHGAANGAKWTLKKAKSAGAVLNETMSLP